MSEQPIEPVFVEFIPEYLQPGQIYISTQFRTASHLCACGCGTNVVTPIKPAKWRFTYDGETVSLSPSIGRWQLPCKSHYCIVKNTIVWARSFSADEIHSVQQRDAQATREYYEHRADASGTSETVIPSHDAPILESLPGPGGLWTMVRRWLHRR